MRGAEDPADQVPAAETVETGWRLNVEHGVYWLSRTRNGRVVYRLGFNTPEAVHAAIILNTI